MNSGWSFSCRDSWKADERCLTADMDDNVACCRSTSQDGCELQIFSLGKALQQFGWIHSGAWVCFLPVAVCSSTYLQQVGYHSSPAVQEKPGRSLVLRQEEYSIILLHQPTLQPQSSFFCYFQSSVASTQNPSEYRSPCDSGHWSSTRGWD